MEIGTPDQRRAELVIAVARELGIPIKLRDVVYGDSSSEVGFQPGGPLVIETEPSAYSAGEDNK